MLAHFVPLLAACAGPTGTADPAPPADRMLVSAGSALVGNDSAPDEAPARTIELDAFAIDRLEASLADWALFTDAGGYGDRSLWSDDGWGWRRDNPDAPARDRSHDRPDDHPVIDVTFYEAEAYCAWRGGRLPTEWEWERAARGPADVAAGNPWPFGDEAKENVANWFQIGKYAQFMKIETWGVGEQLGQGRSPAGAEHMAGNVWEWTSSPYSADATAEASEGPWRVMRGGSWMNLWSYCTTTHREPARPDEGRITVGVRCVSDDVGGASDPPPQPVDRGGSDRGRDRGEGPTHGAPNAPGGGGPSHEGPAHGAPNMPGAGPAPGGPP